MKEQQRRPNFFADGSDDILLKKIEFHRRLHDYYGNCGKNLESVDFSAFHGLTKRFEILVRDFVFKATSPYLPRAYLQIPGTEDSYYKDQVTPNTFEEHGVTLEDLRQEERDSLFYAFFMFELTCLTSNIRAEGSLLAPALYTHDADELAWWLGSPGVITAGSPMELSPTSKDDIDMMKCVHEYYRTLVGARAARVPLGHALLPKPANSKYPNPGEEDNRRLPLTGLVFPDDMYFDPELYIKCRSSSAKTTELIDIIAASGTELIINMLNTDDRTFELFVSHL
ncbi:hypothetical protein FGRMN_9476 [Fusarium graminum]|nr:hypothetical protein FGRMN_9476 [Fusarium graminum]